jgi:DNA modification methylase
LSATVLHGDCLELMASIPDGSVDMICCDLPYGTTACKWDTVIPFAPLWEQYKRVIKKNGAIVLTASQPFTSALVMSNLPWFRYELIWEKTIATNFMSLKKQPGKKHENVCVFYREQPHYFAQMEHGEPYADKPRKRTVGVHVGSVTIKNAISNEGTRYPGSVHKFSNRNNGTVHPTQKPVALIEYLIKTYTNEGDTVLDNCMGSGTAGVACINTGRKFIGIERDPEYFRIASERIAAARDGLGQPAPKSKAIRIAKLKPKPKTDNPTLFDLMMCESA